MIQMRQHSSPDRIRSAIAVAALHAVLGYAFVSGLDLDVVRSASDTLAVFDVSEALPPPPIEESRPRPKRDPEGAAAPPGMKARPSPVVAPVPEVRLPVPPPIAAAPVPGAGIEPRAGASDRPGPGTGAGGVGTGLGSGGSGSGTGGGGIAIKARQIAGRIKNSDYPRGAYKARAEGTVDARFMVATNGRAEGCAVIRSSGNAELDAATCRLIERRYRYKPARDAEGRAVPEVRIWRQFWWLEAPTPSAAPPPWVQIPAGKEEGLNPLP